MAKKKSAKPIEGNVVDISSKEASGIAKKTEVKKAVKKKGGK